ncbi:tip elongation aberrant protein 1-like [Gigantopelta aegis]|uniref:tip elongation aberrant protein 1-like n=1 Tax=Gigantopelta aegis TaxID=1735272 RepID=UPI001B88B993|nr:tip elongation aberrant protein 1-like [Gigantopelta aegis]
MTKVLCFFFVLLIVFTCTTSQEWSWIEGEQFAGVLSLPSYPGGRSGSSIWTDVNSDVWMFGGRGVSITGGGHSTLLNELWKYNMGQGKWTLVHPGTMSMTSSQETLVSPEPRQLAAACGVTNSTFVVFGGLGTEDRALADTWVYYVHKKHWIRLSETTMDLDLETNDTVPSPSGRGDMVSWCLPDKMLIFSGVDSNNNISSDLWRFSLKDMMWSEIRNSENVSDRLINGKSKHYPRARNGATSWVVNNNTVYMFGGNVLSTNILSRHLNIGYTSDLWRYNLGNNTWNYMSGHSNSCYPGVYGRFQSRDPTTLPGCRRRAASWADHNGNLWMFGGDGTDTDYPSVFHTAKLLSDVWLYEVHSGIWMWFGGRNQGESKPVYLRKGEASSAGLPGGRCDSMAWVGPGYTFYLFGGVGHDGRNLDGYLNDLWVMYMEDVIGPERGVAGGLLVFFILLAVTCVLAMCVIALYARDKHNGMTRRSLRFTAKYSKLSDTVE